MKKYNVKRHQRAALREVAVKISNKKLHPSKKEYSLSIKNTLNN